MNTTNITVSVEKKSSTERQITVSVLLENINSEVDARLKKLTPKIRVAGFRKGKVPLHMLQKQHSGAILDEIISDKIKEAYFKAIEQENLNPLGMPRIEVVSGMPDLGSKKAANTTDHAADSSAVNSATADPAAVTTNSVATNNADSNVGNNQSLLVFRALIEVYPEIELADLSQISIEKYETSVADEDVDAALKDMQRKNVKWIDAATNEPQRKIQNGDKIVIDFATKIHGETAEAPKKETEEKDVEFELGAGEMWPEFEAHLIDKVIGDKVEFTLTFPETHIERDVAGKTADFSVEIKELSSAELPPLDDDFAVKSGVTEGGVEALRAKVRAKTEGNVKTILQENFRETLLGKITELHASSFAAPSTFVDAEIKRLQEKMQRQFEALFGAKKTIELPRETFKGKAEQNIMSSMLLGKIAEVNNITADVQQVRAAVEKYASTYHKPQEAIDWYYADEKRLKGIESEIVTEAVFAYLEKTITITPKQVSYTEALALYKPSLF